MCRILVVWLWLLIINVLMLFASNNLFRECNLFRTWQWLCTSIVHYIFRSFSVNDYRKIYRIRAMINIRVCASWSQIVLWQSKMYCGYYFAYSRYNIKIKVLFSVFVLFAILLVSRLYYALFKCNISFLNILIRKKYICSFIIKKSHI